MLPGRPAVVEWGGGGGSGGRGRSWRRGSPVEPRRERAQGIADSSKLKSSAAGLGR